MHPASSNPTAFPIARATRSRWTGADRRRAADSGGPRILVAEDDADMRRLLVGALRGRGYDVLEARDGGALLGHLGSALIHGSKVPTIDLVVTDVRMPAASGLDVLTGLRRAGWQTPVILLTAFGDPALHARAAELGALAVFDKPFDIARLCRFVCEVEPLQ